MLTLGIVPALAPSCIFEQIHPVLPPESNYIWVADGSGVMACMLDLSTILKLLPIESKNTKTDNEQ